MTQESILNSELYFLSHLKHITIGEGTKLRLSLNDFFQSTVDDTLTFSVSDERGLSAWVNARGELVLGPQDGQAGNYTLEVSATDDAGNSIVMPTTVMVGSKGTQTDTVFSQPDTTFDKDNHAPIVATPLDLVSIKEEEKLRMSLTNYFSDPDGDAMTYSLTGGRGLSAWINARGELVLGPRDGQVGNYTLDITATDIAGDSVTMTTAVKVGSDGTATVVPKTPIVDFSPKALVATSKTLSAGTLGAQEWGDDVVLTGYDVHGDIAEVAYSEEFTDIGFGIKGPGSRWDGQIDYFEWGGARSEKMVIDFNGDVTDVVLRVSMLGRREGPEDVQETGQWKAYDNSGRLVAKGLIGPDQSMLGDEVREANSYGIYPIEIATDKAFERLEISATQFDYGASDSFEKNYGENSSDFGISGIEYLRLEAADEFVF